MSEIWFTSDTHFGHKNILEYEKEARPFKTLEEMHETLINNWNNTVGKKDTVYHLGDFAFGRDNIGIAAELNGRKKLVMGNHDTYSSLLYLAHFERLFGCFYWRRCILTHIPVNPDNLGSRFFLNVHGHLHSKQVTTLKMNQDQYDAMWRSPDEHMGSFIFPRPDPNYFNVSVEQNGLKPVNSSVIMDRLKELDDGLLPGDGQAERRREGYKKRMEGKCVL